MEIKDFYDLGSKLVSSTMQVSAVELNKNKDEDSELYDQDMLLQGCYNDIFFPVVFKQKYGETLRDVIDTGWGTLYLISDKMKSVLENNHLTGWRTFSVKVLDKKDGEIKSYHGLSITGRCGPIDYNKSKIIEKRLTPNGPVSNYYKGLHVGLDTWDGSDFFLPEKYFAIVITQRAAEVLKKNKLSNIMLRNLSEIEIDDFTVKLALSKQDKEK